MNPIMMLQVGSALLLLATVITLSVFAYQWYQKNVGILAGIAGEVTTSVNQAFDPKIPGKKPCPDGMRDDGVSCWKEDYGNGVGTIMAKRDCGEGLRDDGTSCWKDDKTLETQNAGYHSCPGGTTEIGKDCWDWNGIKKKAEDRRYCAEGYSWDGWVDGGKCVKNCPQGYYRNGLFCSPDGGAGIKTPVWERNYCPDGKNEVDGLCFAPCKPGWKYAGGSVCVPDDAPAGIRLTAFDRYQCPPDDAPEYTVLSGALCYRPKE